ncbi:MAG TPA: ParB/RepB/Spo0J family partition protein [Ktedonobacterales bacterium]|jgi:ParB family chromosome partitioning protein
MPQQRARLNANIAKTQLGLNIGSPILAEIAGAKGGSSSQAEQTIEQVAIELIQPNPFQPRRDFWEKEIEELADVMRSMGFFGSLLGRRQQRHIQLAYGERRLRAAKAAGLTEVPIEIRTLSDEEMFNIALVENEQRRDLTQLEVGEALLRAKDLFNLSERDIAARLGKSKGYVRNRIEVGMLPDDLKEVLRQPNLESFTSSHALELNRIEDQATRAALTKKVVEGKYNYQETKVAVENELFLGEEAGEERTILPTSAKLQGREVARGVNLLRKKSEELIVLAQHLATDERINRQDLRNALDQLYSKIEELANELG